MSLLQRIASALGLITPEPMPCPRCRRDDLVALEDVTPVPSFGCLHAVVDGERKHLHAGDLKHYRCNWCGWLSLWDVTGPVPLLVRSER